jgi:hypothetical protein
VGVGEFVRQSRKVRRSGTTVTVYDLSHPDNTFGTVSVITGDENTPAKYLVQCEDHDNERGVKTYTEAWKIALDPATFCKACKSHG